MKTWMVWDRTLHMKMDNILDSIDTVNADTAGRISGFNGHC